MSWGTTGKFEEFRSLTLLKALDRTMAHGRTKCMCKSKSRDHLLQARNISVEINVACVGAQRWLISEAQPSVCQILNLKIWNWYKLLTLWKVVLIDLYGQLSNSLYAEHEAPPLFWRNKIIYSLNWWSNWKQTCIN